MAKKLFKKGNSCEKIGKHFNVSESTIYNRFKEIGFDVSQKINLSKIDIIDCFTKGMIFKDVANYFNVSEPTLRKNCKRYGIKYKEIRRLFKLKK